MLRFHPDCIVSGAPISSGHILLQGSGCLAGVQKISDLAQEKKTMNPNQYGIFYRISPAYK